MEGKSETIEVAKSPDRLQVLTKIQDCEKLGKFDQDVENDPPALELYPNQIDYTKKRLTSKIRNKIANFIMKKGIQRFKKSNALIIKDVIGAENLKNIKTGAIITCNHFNPFDNFGVEEAFAKAKLRHKKLWKIINEGNYTNPPMFPFFFRNCNNLPLSRNIQTMKKLMIAVTTLLNKKDFILIYPEQAMWWNYRKPRPLKDGAYKFAVNNNVPVVPMFITINDSSIIGPDGFAVQEFTVHVLPPIYADQTLSRRQNIQAMKAKNYEMWCQVYETQYGQKVTYTTPEEILHPLFN